MPTSLRDLRSSLIPGALGIASGLTADTTEPKVMVVTGKDVYEFQPEAARKLALDILRAASDIESEAYLAQHFLNAGGDTAGMEAMIADFREARQQG